MSEWISVNDRLPDVSFSLSPIPKFLVRVQNIRGGNLRDSYHYEVCDCISTMLDSHYFSIKDPGIVTHWMLILDVE